MAKISSTTKARWPEPSVLRSRSTRPARRLLVGNELPGVPDGRVTFGELQLGDFYVGVRVADQGGSVGVVLAPWRWRSTIPRPSQ